MVRTCLVLFFLIWTNSFFSQSPSFIEWGPDNLVNSRIGILLPDKQLDFYVAEINQFLFKSSSSVSRYEVGKKIKTQKIKTVYNGVQFTIEDIITFRGQLIIFFSEKKGGVKTLFMLQYDNELLPVDEMREIASFAYGSKVSTKGEFSIIKSQNENYFCVNYFLPGKNEKKDLFGFIVFDSLFTAKNSKELELPFKPEFSAIEARHLSNTGEFAVGLSIFNYASNGMWRDYSRIEKSVLIYSKNDSLKQEELFIDKNRVYNYQIHSLNLNGTTSLFVTGTYGEQANGGAKGVFFQHLVLSDSSKSFGKVLEFPTQFLEEETQKNRLDFIDHPNNSFPLDKQLLNYAFRNVFPQEDGGIIIVAEQYYFYEQATTDARGMTQMVNHYQYNDVLVYKIDSVGNFSWIKKIPKSQHSINDYGYFLSTKVLENKGVIYCYFNDITDNYDDMGNFSQSNYTFHFPVRKKECALVEVRINAETGNEKRTILSRTEDTDGFVSLKISQINQRTKELIFYSTRIRDQFGLLSFN